MRDRNRARGWELTLSIVIECLCVGVWVGVSWEWSEVLWVVKRREKSQKRFLEKVFRSTPWGERWRNFRAFRRKLYDDFLTTSEAINRRGVRRFGLDCSHERAGSVDGRLGYRLFGPLESIRRQTRWLSPSWIRESSKICPWSKGEEQI